jgi:haloacetate dehalogenase
MPSTHGPIVPEAIEERSRVEYRRAMTPATIAAMCGDYRASFHLDREDDAADRHAGRRITVPVLVVTGDAETQLADAPDVWRAWTSDLEATTVPGGHFIPKKHRHNSSSGSSPFYPGRHIREASERHRSG